MSTNRKRRAASRDEHDALSNVSDDDDFVPASKTNKVLGQLKTLLLLLPNVPSGTYAVILNIPQPQLRRLHDQYLSNHSMNTTSIVDYGTKALTKFTSEQITGMMKIMKKTKACFTPSKICTELALQENEFAFHWVLHLGQMLSIVPSPLTGEERAHDQPYSVETCEHKFFYHYDKRVYNFSGSIVDQNVVQRIC